MREDHQEIPLRIGEYAFAEMHHSARHGVRPACRHSSGKPGNTGALRRVEVWAQFWYSLGTFNPSFSPAPNGALHRGVTMAHPTPKADPTLPVWRQPDGAPVSCLEKIKVLNQNYAELRQVAQDALEDALLMGCNEDQIREAFRQVIEELHNPYQGKK